MKPLVLVALGALFAGSDAAAQTVSWAQTCDSTTIAPLGAPSCLNASEGIVENLYHRVFDTSDVDTTNHSPGACGPNPAPVAVAGDQAVTEIRVGVESSTTAAGSRVLHLAVYDASAASGAPREPGTLPLLGTVDHVLADTGPTVAVVPVPPGLVIPDSVTYVQLTLRVECGQPQRDLFFWGMNQGGEVPASSSFLSAPECGISEPISMADALFPGLHGILEMSTEPAPPSSIGTIYCTPAVANSTGQPATLGATGSTVALQNDVTLHAASMPQSQFGYFLASPTQGFIANPGGSAGNFCLGSGPQLGRYVNDVMNSGATGTFTMPVDLNTVPTAAPPGTVAVGAGDTWNFQCWYRDGATNNFSDAVSITFQ